MKTSVHFMLHGWLDPVGSYWIHVGICQGVRQTSIRPDHMDNDIRCFYDPWIVRILTGVEG